MDKCLKQSSEERSRNIEIVAGDDVQSSVILKVDTWRNRRKLRQWRTRLSHRGQLARFFANAYFPVGSELWCQYLVGKKT